MIFLLFVFSFFVFLKLSWAVVATICKGTLFQMVVVLKKLTSGAMLSPNEAAEEFREGIIRCLRGMLFRIQPALQSLARAKRLPC